MYFFCLRKFSSVCWKFLLWIMICFVKCFLYIYQFFCQLESILRGLLLWLLGKGGRNKWTTALSNSMKLWAMPCRATWDGWVMVESSDEMWSTGEGNGKLFQYSCLESPMNSMKRQKDRTGRPGVLQSVGSQRVRHDWATERNWTELGKVKQQDLLENIFIIIHTTYSGGLDCDGNSAGGEKYMDFQ